MKLTVTAAELKELAYSSAEENNYLWNDGAETWTLENLADELTDETLEGMEPESTITLTAVSLSEEGEREFVRGFCNAAPDWYTDENGTPIDSEASCPWCEPWHAGIDFWFLPQKRTAYEMGRAFYIAVADEMASFAPESQDDEENS